MQRELLGCDAEGPLEIWNSGDTYQHWDCCVFVLKNPKTDRYVYRWWCFIRYWTYSGDKNENKTPATMSRSWSISPSNPAEDLWLQAVLQYNNALLIFLSRVHNERKVSSKRAKSCCFQYLGASCLHFVMRVHFSVLKWQDFQPERSR